ncbi:MAG: hypothetical protein EA360_08175 [Balneolaceae bacterium]|nr:MAG: hypothetical protein EA360_08175 [Balneolaceae bacterium]
MRKEYSWEKNFFGTTTYLYHGGARVGNLVAKSFSGGAVGEMGGKVYEFRNSGILNLKTEVTEKATGKLVATIRYNSFQTRATIDTDERRLLWKSKNLLGSKWEMENSRGERITYKGYNQKGVIETETDNEMLLLTGLFARNYYWQSAFSMAAIFFLVFTRF